LIPQTTSGDLVVKSRTNDVTDYGATDAGIGDDTDDIQDAIDDLPIW
jgi:polygalacturonase